MANNILTEGKTPSIPMPPTESTQSEMLELGLTTANSTPPIPPTNQTEKWCFMKEDNHSVFRGDNSSKGLNTQSAPPPPPPSKPTKGIIEERGLTSAYQTPPPPPIKTK